MCASILQWATFIAVAGYTFVTWRILIKTNKQNALSTVLQLFVGIKNDYNGVEVYSNVTKEYIHGYNAFMKGFNLSNQNASSAVSIILFQTPEQTQPNYFASFRFIITNFSSLLDKIIMLDQENLKTIVPFVLSFYTERLQPFVDLILVTYEKYPHENRKDRNDIFKKVADQIENLKAC